MKLFVKGLISVLVLVFLGFIVVKKLSDASYGAPNVERGEKLYTANCMACHGERGLGDGAAANAMAVSPDSIYKELKNPFGFKSELMNSVLTGDNGQGGTMPAFKGVLNKEDINDIFGYILYANESAPLESK